MQTRKLVASAAAVLTLGTGGLAIAAVNPFSTAGAATTATTPTTTPATGSAPTAAIPARGHVLQTALAGLVKDGTLTQAQSDAVTAAVKQEVGKQGVLKRLGQNRGEIVKTAASAIGIKPLDLVTALKGGQSIADVAKAHGVEANTVTDALVKQASAKVDQAVTAGKLTAAQAAKVKARLPKIAERVVAAHRK